MGAHHRCLRIIDAKPAEDASLLVPCVPCQPAQQRYVWIDFKSANPSLRIYTSLGAALNYKEKEEGHQLCCDTCRTGLPLPNRELCVTHVLQFPGFYEVVLAMSIVSS